MRHRKRVPPLLLEKGVSRVEQWCWWCKYPIVEFCALYALAVMGRQLGPVFCTSRCGETEARLRGRGPVEVR